MRAVLLALCVACAFTIDITDSGFTNHQQQVLAEIKATKWGSWIVSYAEVHLESKGPLQELLQAVDELIQDLNDELAELTKNFNRRTDNHNREVIRLQQEIDTASRDIFIGGDLADNVLIPQEDRIQKNLAQLKSNIADNRKNLEVETLQRSNEHTEFEAKVAEHNAAIGAVDESLGLLAQLSNPSLVQISKIQGNLQMLEKKLNQHTTFAPLVKALIELATEKAFADQSLVKEIVTAFNNLRNELVAAVNQLTTDENAAQAAFNDRVVQLNSEFADFQRQVLLRNAELTRTQEKLAETQAYVAQRSNDKVTFQSQLDAENDQYAAETDSYNNLVAQYQKELDASNQANALLTQPSFQDYVNKKTGF